MGLQAFQEACRHAARCIPGMSIAVFGVALSLYTLEANRMSSFQSVGFAPSTPIASSLFVVVLQLLFFVVYLSRPSFRLHRNAAVGFAIALAYAGASLCLANNGLWIHVEQFGDALRAVQNAASTLLVVCWIEVLVPYRAKCVAITLALSLCALGGVNIVSSLFRADAAHVFVAVLPLVSVSCLYWFKDHGQSLDVAHESAPANARAMQTVDASIAPRQSALHQRTEFLLSFVIPFGLFTFAFGNVHYSWIPAQDGSFVSVSIQIAAGIGTFLGGITIALLATFFWGRRKIQLYLFMALPILLCALYLTAVMAPAYSFSYVLPLNIAQKIVLFIVLMTPFLAPRARPPLAALSLALASYQLGKVLSVITQDLSSALAYSICVTAAIMGILVCMTVSLIIGKSTPASKAAKDKIDRAESVDRPASLDGMSPVSKLMQEHGRDGIQGDSHESKASEEDKNSSGEPRSREMATADASHHSSEPANATETQRRIAACHTVAEEFKLTRREEEVLQLLSEGMNAQAIAETLVVSMSTAKSHMRSIYAKLEVHAQNELIILVHHHME